MSEIRSMLEHERQNIEIDIAGRLRQPNVQGFVFQVCKLLDHLVLEEKLEAFDGENQEFHRGRVSALQDVGLQLIEFVSKAKEKA